MLVLNSLRACIDYLESQHRKRGARWHIERNMGIGRLSVELHEKLLRVEQLESAIAERTNIEPDALRFYFESFDEPDTETDKEANGICAQLFRYTSDVYSMSVGNALDKLRQASDEYIWKSVCYALLPSNDMQNPPKSYTEFERQIMALPWSEEQRLFVIDVYRNRLRYIDEIGSLLLSVEAALLSCESLYEPLITEFESRYINNAFMSELAQARLVEIDSFSHIEIRPSLFDNGLFSMIAPLEFESHAIINMGICFWDIFLMRTASVTNENSGMQEIIKLLADKTRMDIIRYLKRKESYGQELSREFKLSRNAIYKHMNKLLEYNLVRCKVTRKKVLYSLNLDTFRRFISALSSAILDD